MVGIVENAVLLFLTVKKVGNLLTDRQKYDKLIFVYAMVYLIA